MSDETPVTPVPSATILVVRDGKAGLEVLMVERHQNIEFGGGALVFPGGKVTPSDHDRRWRRRALAKRHAGRNHLSTMVAALRELFEETGLVLMQDGEGRMVGEKRRRDLARRFQSRVEAEKVGLFHLADHADLYIDCRSLVPFAHWITPRMAPKRYDTLFFLAAAPAGQVAMHDGREMVHTTWLTAEEALSLEARGVQSLMFPTRLNLRRLAESRTIRQALAHARQRPIVPVVPEIVRKDGKLYGRIPEEAGYGAQTEFLRF